MSIMDAFNSDLEKNKNIQTHRFQYQWGVPSGPVKGPTQGNETTWFQVGPPAGVDPTTPVPPGSTVGPGGAVTPYRPGVGPAAGAAPNDPRFATWNAIDQLKKAGLKLNNKNLRAAGIPMNKKQAQNLYKEGVKAQQDGEWWGQNNLPGWMGGSAGNATDWRGDAQDLLRNSQVVPMMDSLMAAGGQDGKFTKREWKDAGGKDAFGFKRNRANEMLGGWRGVAPELGYTPPVGFGSPQLPQPQAPMAQPPGTPLTDPSLSLGIMPVGQQPQGPLPMPPVPSPMPGQPPNPFAPQNLSLYNPRFGAY